jgi:hypothetical protein
MSVKWRKIEVDSETADLLEARATARGMSVAEFLADKQVSIGGATRCCRFDARNSIPHRSPDRGRPVRDAGARELIVPFGKSAYIVRHSHNARRQEVVIFRIWHGREARE